MSLPLALSLMGNLIVGLFVVVCLALMLIVLVQKGRGGGVGAAFGGGGAGSLLGTKTGDFLTWVTIGLVALFLVLAVLMGKYMRPTGVSSLAPMVPAATQEQAPATGDQPVTTQEPTPAAGEQPAEATPETPAAAQPEQPAQVPAAPAQPQTNP